MVLPIIGRAALLLGKKVAKNIAKKKKKPKKKKKKETMAEELERLENDPELQQLEKDMKDPKTLVGQAFDMIIKGKKPIKKSRGGLAGRLAKRGYGKARK